MLSGKDKNEVNELFKSNIKFNNLKLKCDKYDHYEKLNAMYDNDKISKLMKKETFREIGKRAKSVIKNIIFPDKFVEHNTPENQYKAIGMDSHSIVKKVLSFDNSDIIPLHNFKKNN